MVSLLVQTIFQKDSVEWLYDTSIVFLFNGINFLVITALSDLPFVNRLSPLLYFLASTGIIGEIGKLSNNSFLKLAV